MIPYCILAIEDESDRVFMEELYLQYNRLMYGEIFQLVHDTWTTEDLMQSTLEKLIDKVQLLRSMDRTHRINYVITACKNRARNYLRDQRNHPNFQLNEEWDSEDLEQSRTAIEHRLITEEDRAILAKVWPKLDEKSRWILEGRYIQERFTAEMAEELGIKPDSFRMALTRARKNAYQLLEKEFQAEG